MGDPIFDGWLECQRAEGLALADSSDLVTLVPERSELPRKYVVEFRCKGLVTRDGDIVEADNFVVGLWFPPDYLRHVNPYRVVTLLEPATLWHPNYGIDHRVICVGPIPPGTSLVSLIFQIFEVLSYQRVNMDENDALNWDACVWARSNTSRFPIDARPLKRRELALEIAPASPEHGP